ncbi:MAG: OmpA family protein [Flavobacteriales bacterium]|nr:OmpA family protein [Flavobacteriales bacterium]
MRIYTLFFLITIFFPLEIIGQRSSYYNCEQGISLSQNNFYHIAFQGRKGIDRTNLNGYGTDGEITKNQIWLFFVPPSSGQIKLKVKDQDLSFSTFVFAENKDGICSDFKKSKAKLLLNAPKRDLLLSRSLFIEEGLKYAIVLVAAEKIKDSLELEINFSPQDSDGNKIIDSLLFDLTKPSKDKKYTLCIRNFQDHMPVKGKISFNGSNEINGAYVASDLIMNLKRNVKKCELKVDAEGFLSYDEEDYEILLGDNGFQDTIYLKPLVRGTVAKIDEIYFAAGMAIILEESAPKLNRLRDFLLVNPTVHIEIQGHVNGDGKKPMRSKRLSKKRAKSVLDYLIDAGISSDRLSSVGFGFDKPVHDEPKNEMEKEANRRVEVLIN